jgi:NAD(P)-dependent dehydrogenase (short-subunit alcohol dehydrogenase family)
MSTISVVTGANSGIGRATAIHLAAQGHTVYGTVRSISKATKLQAMAADAGVSIELVELDIADDDSVQQGFARILEATGGVVDVLVNNAGVGGNAVAEECPTSYYLDVMNVNLCGAVRCSQQVLPGMRERHRGAIVNITSISVYTASINRGDYCMVKAGLAMMTKLFADRLANDGINVYEIRPGVIATDMTGGVKAKYDKLILEDERGITPIRRWGQPEDIGRAVRAIAEDRFPFSTGACFDVDGGFHLHRL